MKTGRAVQLALALALVLFTSAHAAVYKAKLTREGKDVKTKAEGVVTITQVGPVFTASVKLKNIVNFVAAHIHTGAAGQMGPPVVNFWTPGTPPISGSFVYPFVFNVSSLDLAVLDKKGYYFNVHTLAHPLGEIRGQFVKQ